MRWTTQDDDLRGAARFRDRKTRETHRPGALNDNVVAHAHADSFDAVKRSRQCATRADDCFGRQVFGNLEDRCSGPQVNVISVAAEEMWRDTAIVGDAVSLAFE